MWDVDKIMEAVRGIGVKVFKYGNKLNEESVYNFVIVKTQFQQDDKVPTASATFGPAGKPIVMFNADWFNEIFEQITDDTDREAFVRFVFKHELLHIAMLHPLITGNYNRFVMNCAADAFVNDIIAEGMALAKKGLLCLTTPEIYLLSMFGKESKLNVIDSPYPWTGPGTQGAIKLFEDAITNNKPIALVPSQLAKFHAFDLRRYYEYLMSLLKDDVYAVSPKKITKPVGIDDIVEAKDSSVLEGDVLKDFIDTVTAELGRSQTGSGLLKLAFGKLLYKRNAVPEWKKLLRASMRNWFGKERKRIDIRLREGRRWDYYDIKRLPSSGKLLVFVDASGSISKEQLQAMIAEVETAKRLHGFADTIVVYDTEVRYKSNLKELKAKLKDGAIKAGGGTDINNVMFRMDREQYNGVVILTDGYDDVPSPELIKRFVQSEKQVLILLVDTPERYIRVAKQLGYTVAELKV